MKEPSAAERGSGTPPLPVPELNARRREAVALRLDGRTLAEAALASRLSVPTVVSAYRAWQQGGWEAVRESTPDFALRLLELVDLPYEDIRGTQEGLWRESVDCFTPLTKTRSWLGRPPGYLDLARNYGGVLDPLLFPKILNDS